MKIYDYDVKYYSSVDAVVITDRYWRTYNCNKEDDVRIILNSGKEIHCDELHFESRIENKRYRNSIGLGDVE